LTGIPAGIAIVTAQRPALTGSAGIGLRSPHVAEVAATRPKLGFIEVHAENYMAETVALDRWSGRGKRANLRVRATPT
jgi:hypothetical protein